MIQTRLFIAALALAAAPIAVAQPASGSGAPATQKREAAGFNGVALAIPARVDVVQGAAEGVTLTADDNVIGDIETVVERGTLQIRWRTRNYPTRLKTDIRVTVHARTLESIDIAGSGEVHAPAVSAPRMTVHIAGSGDVILGGKAESLDARISGSGDIRAARLETERANVRIAGSGDATVWARKALHVNVAGSGDVRYLGEPAITKRIAGSGSVRKSGDAPG